MGTVYLVDTVYLATETETREKTASGGRREAEQATGFMNDGDQTHKEVFTPMADLLTPKTVINIGCWNVGKGR